LEAAQICHEAEQLFHLQEQVSEALQDRNNAINALSRHERIHAMPTPL
jgi:hypothetical protein